MFLWYTVWCAYTCSIKFFCCSAVVFLLIAALLHSLRSVLSWCFILYLLHASPLISCLTDDDTHGRARYNCGTESRSVCVGFLFACFFFVVPPVVHFSIELPSSVRTYNSPQRIMCTRCARAYYPAVRVQQPLKSRARARARES